MKHAVAGLHVTLGTKEAGREGDGLWLHTHTATCFRIVSFCLLLLLLRSSPPSPSHSFFLLAFTKPNSISPTHQISPMLLSYHTDFLVTLQVAPEAAGAPKACWRDSTLARQLFLQHQQHSQGFLLLGSPGTYEACSHLWALSGGEQCLLHPAVGCLLSQATAELNFVEYLSPFIMLNWSWTTDAKSFQAGKIQWQAWSNSLLP